MPSQVRAEGGEGGLLGIRFLVALCVLCASAGRVVAAAEYPREHIYDTSVHGDEALVNVSLTANRWPDCTTLESAVSDIFRLEGVLNESDQEKALALWKWFRILVSATGGHYAYEGPPGEEKLCHDPHRIFTVYGHHQCDGLSWAMAALWRAAGYMAFDECTWGHTTAALRYRDADGQIRYHSFDPQRRYYHWDEANRRVGTRSLPVMRGMVFRHLTAPQHLHSLRTSLRVDESIERRWDNEGYIVPSGPDKRAAEKQTYYAYRPGAAAGIYAAVGQEVQILRADTRQESFARSLHAGSQNVACSAPDQPSVGAPGLATLHPKDPGKPAAVVYRLAPPYVVADARCEVTLVKKNPDDLCQILLSRNGEQWVPAYTKETLGAEKVVLGIGRGAWQQGRPNVYTAYDFFIKVELSTRGKPRDVGVQDLKIVVFRMLNKRTLPQLRPGRNALRVTADRITPGLGLELAIEYRVEGVPHRQTRFITQFPYYFSIDVPSVPEDVRDDYDQHFNEGPLRMVAISMRLQPAGAETKAEASLQEAEALPLFSISSPHPAKMGRKEPVPRPEREVRETSGFFPQSDDVRDDEVTMRALLQDLKGKDVERRWLAAEDLGAYPRALAPLLAELPSADGDQTLFLCKALAQLKDRRAIRPLLEKWKRAPGGAPGTRYVPDVLAAIGDRSFVPQLVAPLTRCRFDYRFQIAHALGILGGPEAERALQELAAGDPFPAVREEAARALRELRH